MLKISFGYVASNILFWIGDLISKPMHYFDWGWLYPVYNKIMIASADVQDWSGADGPWKKVKEKKRRRNIKKDLKKVLNETESQ